MIIWIICAIFIFVLAYILQALKGTSDRLFYEIRGQRVLLVTAHPDDECMFFGPTIRRLVKRRVPVFLLCLSNGNYYKDGKIRKEELSKSCILLGVKHHTLVDDENLTDGANTSWNGDIIAEHISSAVKVYKTNVIITFDRYGVSGHTNHTATYYGVRNYMASYSGTASMLLYSLESTNIIRKYSSFIDIALSYFISERLAVATLFDMQLIKRAMAAHISQQTWYRSLHMSFSRYVILNSLKPIRKSENYEYEY